MHDTLLKIGSFTVSTYEVSLTIAFLLAIGFAIRRSRHEGVDRDLVIDACLWLVIGGLVGARVLYIVTQSENYWNACFHPELVKPKALAEPDCWLALNPFRGGFVYYGGFLGGLAAVLLLARRRKAPFFALADLLAPYLMLGLAFHRAAGCFLGAGCCYGSPTSLPWGIVWPAGTQPWGAYPNQAIHPTQLYETVFATALFLGLRVRRKNRAFNGEIMILMLIGYSVFRFVNEFWRGDKIRGFFLGTLSTSQVISLGLVALGVFWWFRAKSKKPGSSAGQPAPTDPPQAAVS
ncbi:MAG: prolipoprotein diacylglyceryl transferase [Deltaproteobacteria bacterium]|nr:prolipoprotein diacylglyceryl transferase [Deltaproteobacteria bacterium]